MKQQLTLLSACAALLLSGCGPAEPAKPFVRPKPSVAFKPREMADALHAVIAADRQVYARYFEELVGPDLSRSAPVPPHILREASAAVQQGGAEFHYVMRSFAPLDPRNAPETATETEGLKAVTAKPEQNFYAEESLGGRRYFIAVYPEKAALESCVNCHNRHPGSSKRDHKAGDVIGGMVVRVPMEF
jgi:hypothetical protein